MLVAERDWLLGCRQWKSEGSAWNKKSGNWEIVAVELDLKNSLWVAVRFGEEWSGWVEKQTFAKRNHIQSRVQWLGGEPGELAPHGHRLSQLKLLELDFLTGNRSEQAEGNHRFEEQGNRAANYWKGLNETVLWQWGEQTLHANWRVESQTSSPRLRKIKIARGRSY